MASGGAAWRGWFPLDGELTSGRPDHKEGIYFGTELGPDHPAVREGRPLHGANLFPATPPELGAAVLAWIDAMTRARRRAAAGHRRRPHAAGRLVRAPRHHRAHRALPDLPLPARATTTAGASPSTPTTGC